MWLSVVAVICLVTADPASSVHKLTEIFSWRTVHYQYDRIDQLEASKLAGRFVSGNSIIASIARYGSKLFLATPRLKAGVPSTLNYVNVEGDQLVRSLTTPKKESIVEQQESIGLTPFLAGVPNSNQSALKYVIVEETEAKSPPLIPYPSWDMNEQYNVTAKKKTMSSVVNVKVDDCHRLWALDSGIVEELTSKKVEKPPAIFVFQLTDNTLARKYSLKEEDYKDNSQLSTLVVDDGGGNCEKSFAYVADSIGGLIVYSWELNRSYRIENNYFRLNPIWGNLRTSRGTLLQISEGLRGLALSMPRFNGFRDLLFHPLAGVDEFSVSTRVLQNKTEAERNVSAFFHLGDRGADMQSSASVMDLDTGILLYTAVVRNALVCWSTLWGQDINPGSQTVIERFSTVKPSNQGTIDVFEESSYPADLTIGPNGTVWVLTNRLLDFKYEKQDNHIAYRVYSGTIRHIVRGTACSDE